MRSYLISYDLKQPVRDYPRISKAIMAYGYYCKVLESTWIIRTQQTAAQVRDNLQRHVDANDRIAVVGLTGEWASYNLPADAASWLSQQLAA
jgi:hypothetical protein